MDTTVTNRDKPAIWMFTRVVALPFNSGWDAKIIQASPHAWIRSWFVGQFQYEGDAHNAADSMLQELIEAGWLHNPPADNNPGG